MIEVISEGAVNISEGNRGDMRDDLVGSHALVLGPDDDVLYAHTVAGNASPSTTRPRCFHDSLILGETHRIAF